MQLTNLILRCSEQPRTMASYILHLESKLTRERKMGTKNVAFEMETGEEIELELDYSYSYRPGRMYMPNGDPGYPDESEAEINLPQDLEQQLIDFFKTNVMPEWIATIEKRVDQLYDDVADWAREDADSYDCDRDRD